MSAEVRYDFIVVKLNEGVDPEAAATQLAEKLGAKPEKILLVFGHIKDKGPVAIEKGVTRERLGELKQIWDSAGVATRSPSPSRSSASSAECSRTSSSSSRRRTSST